MVDLMKIIRAMIKEEKKGSWEGAKKMTKDQLREIQPKLVKIVLGKNMKNSD